MVRFQKFISLQSTDLMCSLITETTVLYNNEMATKLYKKSQLVSNRPIKIIRKCVSIKTIKFNRPHTSMTQIGRLNFVHNNRVNSDLIALYQARTGSSHSCHTIVIAQTVVWSGYTKIVQIFIRIIIWHTKLNHIQIKEKTKTKNFHCYQKRTIKIII